MTVTVFSQLARVRNVARRAAHWSTRWRNDRSGLNSLMGFSSLPAGSHCAHAFDRRLNRLGSPDIDPVKVWQMDAADQIENMQRIGQAVANEKVHRGNSSSRLNEVTGRTG